MKTRAWMRIGLAGALLSSVLWFQSGCACCRVREAGMRWVSPEPVACWTHAAGDVALKVPALEEPFL